MFKLLVKNRILLLWRKIKKELSCKELVVFLGIMLLIVVGIVCFIAKLFQTFSATNEQFCKAYILILALSFLILLMCVPNLIYKQFIGDKKIDILMAAPVKLNVCFKYEFVLLLIKIYLIVLSIVLMPLLAGKIVLGVKLLPCLVLFIVFYPFVLIFIYLIFFVFYRIFKTAYIKKALLLFGGLVDIIFTIFVMISLNYIEMKEILEYVITMPILKQMYLFLSMFNNVGRIIICLFLWLVVFCFLYWVVYRNFKKVYEETGFNEHKDIIHHELSLKGKKLINCFLWRDRIVFTRDFNIIKQILLYFLLWSISAFFTITNMEKINIYFLASISIIMSMFIVFQISNASIKIDKEKMDILILAGVSSKEVWKQKMMFVSIMSSVVTVIYTILISIMASAGMEVFVNLIVVALLNCIWFSILASNLTMYYHYDNHSAKFKMIHLSIRSVIFTVIYLIIIFSIIIINDGGFFNNIFIKLSVISIVIIVFTAILYIGFKNMSKKMVLIRR